MPDPTAPLRPIARLTWPFIIIALLGFADATFLTIEHYRSGPIPCAITTGCETVTTSRWATIGPIPIALLGALYYLAIIAASLIIIDTKRLAWLKGVALFTTLGLLTSIYLVSLQAFVIHTYCLYCLISAVTSTLIWLWGMRVLVFFKRHA